MTKEQGQSKENRRVLLGIFGIPILVLLFSTGLYYLVDSGTVELGTVNNGELIRPPLKFTDLPLRTPTGEPFDYEQSDPRWTFVVFGDSECAGDCERMLYIARQSIIATGKKMHRLQLAYLTSTGPLEPSFERLIDEEYHGLRVVAVDEVELQALFADAKPQPYQPRTFFVVDPHGWLMMFYQVEDTGQQTLNALGKAVVKDMKRLIK